MVPSWSVVLSYWIWASFLLLFLLQLRKDWRFWKSAQIKKAKVHAWETEEGSDGETLYNSLVKAEALGEENIINLKDRRSTQPPKGEELMVLVNPAYPNLVKRKFFLGIWRSSVLSGLIFVIYSAFFL